MTHSEQGVSSVLPVQPDQIPDELRQADRWVVWSLEMRDGRPTKVPYVAANPTVRASATDPTTWIDFQTALATYQQRSVSGIGFVLGDDYFGFDADDCRDATTGEITADARQHVALINTYTEVSPRAHGVHAIGRGRKPGPRCRTRRFELYDADRFFCMTGHRIDGTPRTVEHRSAELEALYWTLFPVTVDDNGNGRVQTAPLTPYLDDAALTEKARHAKNGATFTALWNGDTSAYPSHSEADQALANLLVFWCGGDAARVDRLFRASGLYRPKWNRDSYGMRTVATAISGCREMYSGHGGGSVTVQTDPTDTDDHADSEHHPAVQLDDFHAYMPMHSYIFAPSRELWPGSSVNARLAPVCVVDRAGAPVLGKNGNPKRIPATAWLDQHQPVEMMTWVPGKPMLIRDRLVSDGGWIARRGCRTFNLYRAPRIDPGDPQRAGQWLDHIRRIYPNDADHLVPWLAHRVQRPHEKINHAIILGGLQGIGKDTLLDPVKAAVGPWNFAEVSPAHLLGRFNGFVKSVILRVSEARDLGDHDRFSLYDHLKTYTAAPPDILRVDEKNIREYAVFNVCGVIVTTNYRTDGLYLPADDRRHYVAWSDASKDDFSETYWNDLWRWYDREGTRHVAAYLAAYDLTAFNPKAPPPKTAAFWDVVDSNRAPEDAELADALERLCHPPAVTLDEIAGPISSEFGAWLKDRKNARQIPHRLEGAGYVAVRNPTAKDGLWRIHERRQVVYGRRDLTPRDRLKAASEIGSDR